MLSSEEIEEIEARIRGCLNGLKEELEGLGCKVTFSVSIKGQIEKERTGPRPRHESDVVGDWGARVETLKRDLRTLGSTDAEVAIIGQYLMENPPVVGDDTSGTPPKEGP